MTSKGFTKRFLQMISLDRFSSSCLTKISRFTKRNLQPLMPVADESSFMNMFFSALFWTTSRNSETTSKFTNMSQKNNSPNLLEIMKRIVISARRTMSKLVTILSLPFSRCLILTEMELLINQKSWESLKGDKHLALEEVLLMI